MGINAAMSRDDSNQDDSDRIVISRREAAARQVELQAQLTRVRREGEALERELLAIDAVLDWYAPAPSGADGRTIREMATEVMRTAGAQMGVKAIIDAIQTRFGAAVPRTSLSPILRKMERRGEVRHVGDKWEIGDGVPETQA